MVKRLLLDADIILYEVSFAAEAHWKYLHAERGEEVLCSPPWEVVVEQLETRIQEIVKESGAEGEPILFFTGKNNFRENIATTFVYKAHRPPKPFHYNNIKVYLKSRFKYFEEDGLEADDLLGIFLTAHPDKYICASRDKDLKQIPGWHYGWEVNKQPAFGPALVDEIGHIELSSGKSRKIKGVGAKFLYCQMLMGDRVDTIPGIDKLGDVKAFNIIEPCTTIREMEEAVLAAYRKAYGDEAEARMVETGRMVYMIRQRKAFLIKLYSPWFHPTQWYDLRTGEIFDS